jgi:hypothetical protein
MACPQQVGILSAEANPLGQVDRPMDMILREELMQGRHTSSIQMSSLTREYFRRLIYFYDPIVYTFVMSKYDIIETIKAMKIFA